MTLEGIYEQIKRSSQNMVVVGYSNSEDQIMKRIQKFNTDYTYEVKASGNW
jgi:hypothetical protein